VAGDDACADDGARWSPTGPIPARLLLRAVAGRAAAEATAAAELAREREALERLRTDLLSTISHELRTPLTLVRTSIGLLLDGTAAPDEAMRRRLLQNIKASSDRMQELVSDLLDLARMRGDRLELRLGDVDLGALAEGALSLMGPMTDGTRQRVSLRVAAPAPVVRRDPDRLERVLLNLLGNAAAFAPEDAGIDVAVEAAGDEARIAVSDSGPGIPPEAMPRLFEQFYSARTSSTRHGVGAGLGLPIAQGIVTAHGGRIWVESTVGVGTTVRVALPLAGPGGAGAAVGSAR
jgi:signal transduction histidine kinase